jgi:hypothetical protein
MRGSSIFQLICSEALSDLLERLRTIIERTPEVVRPLSLRIALNRAFLLLKVKCGQPLSGMTAFVCVCELDLGSEPVMS